MARIQVDRKKIEKFCRQHHVRKLALFGSVLRADFGPDSDVDVLASLRSPPRLCRGGSSSLMFSGCPS
ncbi:MAG TPA: nucleotidyltransferase domain-containing protein [Thermoanaerobaculia bacterium]|nr:nucleotidyltransferase domain-containing protein [Thermoanaerobaculia bacterium]